MNLFERILIVIVAIICIILCTIGVIFCSINAISKTEDNETQSFLSEDLRCVGFHSSNYQKDVINQFENWITQNPNVRIIQIDTLETMNGSYTHGYSIYVYYYVS